jgi:hypothetical protein
MTCWLFVFGWIATSLQMLLYGDCRSGRTTPFTTGSATG